MHPSLFMLALMLIGVAVAVGAAAVVLMAWSLTHPPRMTDGKATWVLGRVSPSDLGLAYEQWRFDTRDERGCALPLAAWWIPNLRADVVGRCAVLVHGYADAKVGAIAWAPLWHALGYNLLVPDLRGHGESAGGAFTAGFFERHDLLRLIDQCQARKASATRELVLFGISAGAATVLGAAAERSDVSAVVLESPYADFPRAAMIHMDRLGAPGRLLQRWAIALAGWLTRADYSAVAPTSLIPRLSCPLLLIQSGNDRLIPADDRATLERAVRALAERMPADVWNVSGAEHLTGLIVDPDQYRQRLETFLQRNGAARRADRAFAPAAE